jgi:Kef-type K+ transport system membrane component KefB
MSLDNASFTYHEPSITALLILTAFLLLLNAVNFTLDKLVYCGLLGQILVGVWFGTPGAQWLSQDTESVVQQLGYIGLIMLVYEGISTSRISQSKTSS